MARSPSSIAILAVLACLLVAAVANILMLLRRLASERRAQDDAYHALSANIATPNPQRKPWRNLTAAERQKIIDEEVWYGRGPTL